MTETKGKSNALEQNKLQKSNL